MNRVTSWCKAWFRRHPLMAIIWVLFFLLCIYSVVAAPTGERPNVLYGVVVLPLMAAGALVYLGRTIDRFKKIRDLTSRRSEQLDERRASAERDDVQ
ncbi:MAG: hypothetical protein ACR2OU_05950 [Thermomicrobiales bacterium]